MNSTEQDLVRQLTEGSEAPPPHQDSLLGRLFKCLHCKHSFRLAKYNRNYYEPDICVTKCPQCGKDKVFFEWGGSAELPNLLGED